MTSPIQELPATITHWLSKALNVDTQAIEQYIQPLAGDGSTRQFFRVLQGESPKVLLLDPQWLLSRDYAAHQRFLRGLGIAVPCFFNVDESLGCLLMEDLGDEHLQQRILLHPQKATQWLIRAAELLAHLHGRGYPVPKELPASSRRFDAEKLSAELAYTREHLWDQYLKGVETPPAAALKALCERIDAFKPVVFCHRDYHSKNILIHQEQLFMIDFQDARLGSPHYDLASLVFDPYVRLDVDQRTQICEAYQTTVRGYALGNDIDWDRFPDELNTTALQRVLKAAGSYASFYNRNGKTSHLQYIKPALEITLELIDMTPDLKNYLSPTQVRSWIVALEDSWRSQ